MRQYSADDLRRFRQNDVTVFRQARKTIFSFGLWCPRRMRELRRDLVNDSTLQFPPSCSNLPYQPRQPKSASLNSRSVLNSDEALPVASPTQSAGSPPVVTPPAQSTTGGTRQWSTASIKFGLFNAQSVGNKFTSKYWSLLPGWVVALYFKRRGSEQVRTARVCTVRSCSEIGRYQTEPWWCRSHRLI